MLNFIKNLTLGKLAKYLSIIAIVSSITLGLIVWIFDIPAYFNSNRSYYYDNLENSITINENKKFNDIVQIETIEIDLRFADIFVTVSEKSDNNNSNLNDEISFICKGEIQSNRDLKLPFLKFNTTNNNKIEVSSDLKGGLRFTNSNVKLEIIVPEEKLNEININIGSSKLNISGNVAKNLILDTSSGDIKISNFNGELLEVESSSGDHRYKNLEVKDLTLSSSSGSFVIAKSKSIKTNIETSTGDIDLMKFTSKENRIDTNSGTTTLDNYSGNLNFSTSSGDLKSEFITEVGEIIIGTKSGSVDINLPKNASFKLRAETNSGHFESNYSLKLNGGYDDKDIDAIVGEGSGKVKIYSSSGNISVNKSE